jgi:LysR family transcriptional regulator of abg operon
VCLLLGSDHVTLTSLAALEPFLERGLLKRLPVDVKQPPVVQYLIRSGTRPLTSPAAALAAEFRRVSRRLRR